MSPARTDTHFSLGVLACALALLLLFFGPNLADPLWSASGLPADRPKRGPWHDIIGLLTAVRL